ncbi:ParB-like nuclease [Escherichia coli]|nr:ParB-like nuclease [Escherichia coli]
MVVSWRYGNVCVQRGVQLRSEDDVTDDADRTEQVQEKASVEEISLPLLTKMSSERTLAVQAALMQQPDKSLALLTWTLCLNVFGSGAYSKPAQISLECKHYSLTSDAPSGKEGAAFMALMAEKARLVALLPEGWSRDMTTFPVTQPGGAVIPAQFLHCVQHPRRSDPRVWSHVTQSA